MIIPLLLYNRPKFGFVPLFFSTIVIYIGLLNQIRVLPMN